MLPRGEGPGLNFPYTVMTEIRIKSYNHRIK